MSNKKKAKTDRHLQKLSSFRIDAESKEILNLIKRRYGFPSMNAVLDNILHNIVLPLNEEKDPKFLLFIEDCEKGVVIHILRGYNGYSNLTKQALNDLKTFISDVYGEAIVYDIVQKNMYDFRRYIALPVGSGDDKHRIGWEKSIIKGYYKHSNNVVMASDVLFAMELWFSEVSQNGEYERIRQSIMKDEMERMIAEEENGIDEE